MRTHLIGLTFVLLFADAKAADVVRVECHGKLRDGISAIGAETTGTIIQFEGTTWELKFKDTAGKDFATAQHKKDVSIVGTLRREEGVEKRVRWIVDVEKFTARDAAKQKDGANVAARGTLRRTQDGTRWCIEAGKISWTVELPIDGTLSNNAEANINKPVIIQGPLKQAAPGEKLVVQADKLETAR